MAFDVSAISAWTNELGNKADLILKPILAAKTLQSLGDIDKRKGITGFTEKIPTLESTTPWQAGASCGFTTSGTTTVTQVSLTAAPIKIQEQICLQDLETYFSQSLLPNNSRPKTFQLLDRWVGRKLEQCALQIESALWQGNTSYTNATHLKLFNGWIQKIDNAGDKVAATSQVSISTSTVRGIMEEIAYDKIPAKIRNHNPIVVCGQDAFNIYMKKLMVDNLYHYDPSNKEQDTYVTNIFGTNVKLCGLPGLNNDNAVDSGALPTAVKNRVFATFQDNLLLGLNTEDDIKDFDVWYSKDDQVLKFMMRFHLGVAVKYTDLVVSYINS